MQPSLKRTRHPSSCLTHPCATLLAVAVAFMVSALAPSSVQGQFGDDPSEVFSDFSLGGFGGAANENTKWKAAYFVDSNGQGKLQVEAKVPEGWHIYSVTQPEGGPLPTRLTIQSPESARLVGDFSPDKPAKTSVSDIFVGVTIEEHSGTVVWSAPIRAAKGFHDSIVVAVDAQICKDDGACIPIEETVTANFVKLASDSVTGANAKPAPPFRDSDYPVEWSAELIPANPNPGDLAYLVFNAKPNATYHVYQAAVNDADFSTNFVFTEKSGLQLGKPIASTQPVSSDLMPEVFYHKGDAKWTIPVQIPGSAAAGEYVLKGGIAYTACTDTSCLQPKALEFMTTFTVGSGSGSAPLSAVVEMKVGERSDVLDAAAVTKWVDEIGEVDTKRGESSGPSAEDAGTDDSVNTAGSKAVTPIVLDSGKSSPKRSFAFVLLLSFLGGVILNFMPCVLPVVGLKVMSFVQQAGADRRRAFLLNFFYAAGILAVFGVLTFLLVILSFSWGEQFTYFPFRLGLTLLMFAMALSYLGVWEIPVPGMMAGKKSQELQQREGLSGAFFKGAFATVLSTPCSGPLLGVIFGLTISLSPLQNMMVMMTIGLGMAIPYVMIGIWPVLVAWLPKPGDWMETLKEFLAFLFLATVAFFFSIFDDADKLPLFVTLIAVWFGCWIIGKVPNWADLEKRLIAWAGGISIATVIGFMAFSYLGETPPAEESGVESIAWVDYDEELLEKYQAEGRTVIIDFTAKWCVNCIVNYKVALNTEATRVMIEELDAVPMLADWTNRNDEIKQKLEELESRSIPVLAIYPGSRPNQPIILRDLVSQSAVLEALEAAGPSIGVPPDATAAIVGM
ncbi:Thiol:disulfide interchange protein DsbD precursor [Novipirellula aureliae]|uniref:Thiol:disulfide interchange protein DsbD n=1 Tax=Novipirellula aureliae TaxID=2527966 RepID=A0A5C6DEX4_9BACT|nr:protein-disulfide reductase DsbD domain-containing protein [Novipirellula aureliae]TWU35793.1 Thiol:disulfide interchange protein DsbD precursor [Novipirellula aureliae]